MDQAHDLKESFFFKRKSLSSEFYHTCLPLYFQAALMFFQNLKKKTKLT